MDVVHGKITFLMSIGVVVDDCVLPGKVTLSDLVENHNIPVDLLHKDRLAGTSQLKLLYNFNGTFPVARISHESQTL